MQLSRTHPVTVAAFEDRNLLASAGLVPALGLAQRCGLGALPTMVWQCRPTKGGHGPQGERTVAGMVAAADRS